MAKKLLIFMVALGLIACTVAIKQEDSHFIKKGSLIYAEDNEAYFLYDVNLMTKKALEDYIDAIAHGHVTHFFMGVNGQRTNYRTKVSEAMWDPLKNDKVFPDVAWTKATRTLYEKGIDPYATWIAKCRQVGISPWVEMRVNDQHFANTANTHKTRARILDFWRDHPEYRRTNRQGRKWSDYAFDYSQKAVRDYKLALVREFLEFWDVDGVSIDWMRTTLNLPEGKEVENAHFITEFMVEVKKMADEWSKKRGHKIGVAVRVPICPKISRSVGLNADEWAKMGLIDVLVTSQSYQTHFDMRIEEWREAIGDAQKHVSIVAATDHGFNPYPCGELWDAPRGRRTSMSMPYSLAWADNCYADGADGLYIYNMMYSRDVWYKIAEEGLSKNKIRRSTRCYPISYIDNDILFGDVGKDFPDTDTQLPRITGKDPVELKIKVGTPPRKADVSVILGFEKADNLADAKFTATLNGVESTSYTHIFLREWADWYGKAGAALAFKFPAEAVKKGYNTFKISTDAKTKIIYTELKVKPQ